MSLFGQLRRPAGATGRSGDDGPADAPAEGSSPRGVVAAWGATVLACLLVLFALVAPNQLGNLTPGAFVRIPVEGLVGLAVLLVLPSRWRRASAVVIGGLLGLLTLLKIIDMGFFAAFDRPFDLLSDWSFTGPAIDLLTGSAGRVGAVAAVIGVVAFAVAVVVFTALAVLRLSRIAVRHRTATTRTLAALSVIWIAAAVLGIQVAPGQPFASGSAAAYAFDDVRQVRAEVENQRAFARDVAADPFRGTPGEDLLAALRGKNVILAFVESYGRVAIQDSEIAPQVDAVLDAGTEQLRAAGFAARSAFLTSPTFGDGSWLAHATLQSGVSVDSQRRYNELFATDRMTLSSAFKSAGWRAVGDVPSNTQDWPEGKFYDFDRIYDARNVGYQGPNFSYATMPDQFTMAAFQRAELATPGHAPVMAEIDLVSSHWPWAPLPQLVDWDAIGNGSVFDGQPAAGKAPGEVWPDPAKVRAAYGESIQYSLNTLISYVRNYGDDDLVLVFLGDHQPNSAVTGDQAGRDVPVTIVAKDPVVLDRVAGWDWQDGLRPGPAAPVWAMSAFRDRFLATFSH
ncbi:sulfatase [Amycolatopsis taiwanensis]|uniref:Sulfatase n=1 Tax=Amycolatopsis taiwanensis TaxID=342230 RepID=A0A9W6VFT3_9PSEU|nr:hypothetical protein Atai01_18180 [Amycolatopsis taiwanensis]